MDNKQQRRRKRKAKKVRQEVERAVARLPLEMVRGEQRERACGACQCCCEAVGVHELEKPMWTRCGHQCEGGCGIYDDRPSSCRSYYCLWQAGLLKGGEEYRPDKLGIIFDFRTHSDIDAISAWEMWEGAADQPHVAELLVNIASIFVVVVRRYKSTRVRVVGQARHLHGLKIRGCDAP